MYFITFIEIMFITIFRNCLFEDNLFKYLKVITPVAFLLYLNHKYIFNSIPNLNLLIIVVVLIIIFYLLIKKDIMEIIVEVILSLISIVVIELFGTIIGIVIIRMLDTSAINLELLRSFIIVCTFILSIFIVNKLKNKNKLKFIYLLKPNKTTIGVFISFILVYLIAKTVYDESLFNLILTLETSIYLITFIVLTLIINNSIRKEVEEKNKLRLENNFKPILDDYVHRLRAREHEYKNHLNAIYSMISLSENKYVKNQVGAYIKNVSTTDNLNDLLYVDNVVLKSILYNKMTEIEQNKINLKYDIKSNFANINLDDMDLVIVLSNLLNNSIEATKGIENSFIEVQIYETYNKGKDNVSYHIKVLNSVSNPKEISISKILENGVSTKGEDRGYGLYNVKKIVKNVNGQILLDLSDNTLEIEIILN